MNIYNWLEKRKYKIPRWAYGYLVKKRWISNSPLVYSNSIVVSDSMMMTSRYDVAREVKDRLAHEMWEVIQKNMKWNIFPDEIEITRREQIGEFRDQYIIKVFFSWSPRIRLTQMAYIVKRLQNL